MSSINFLILHNFRKKCSDLVQSIATEDENSKRKPGVVSKTEPESKSK